MRGVQLVAVFEKARDAGEGQVIFSGTKVEVPTYLNAMQVIERGNALSEYER